MRKIFTITIFFSHIFFVWVSSAGAAEIGSQASFLIDSSYDNFGRTALSASLRKIGAHAYFYIEDKWWDSLSISSQGRAESEINSLAREFDENIYPELTKYYGPLWEPGIDDDDRVTVLIAQLKEGAGGYFNSGDEYPKNISPSSNEREMVYLNALYLSNPRIKSFLAHEFQHLITFYQKDKLNNISEDVWLNEARSEYAGTIVGYDANYGKSNLERRTFDFLKNPSDSLTEWANVIADYGSVDLFMQYLIGRFGDQLSSKMVKSQFAGIASIDNAFRLLGASETFFDVFADWSAANYLNRCALENGRYCYANLNLREKLRVPPTIEKNFSAAAPAVIEISDFVKDWAGYWYKFSGIGSDLKIVFESALLDSNFSVRYLIEKNSGDFEIKNLVLDSNQQGTAVIKNPNNDIISLVVMPLSRKNIANFSSSEPLRQFTLSVTMGKDESPVPLVNPPAAAEVLAPPDFAEGSLIRVRGDYKVYVVSGKFKRWIQTAEIFNSYGHLKWENIIEVMPEQRDFYKDSWLIRAEGDSRVYEVNGDGTKHWLNMTAQQFSLSGRLWAMVYVINKAERDFYKTGADILIK